MRAVGQRDGSRSKCKTILCIRVEPQRKLQSVLGWINKFFQTISEQKWNSGLDIHTRVLGLDDEQVWTQQEACGYFQHLGWLNAILSVDEMYVLFCCLVLSVTCLFVSNRRTVSICFSCHPVSSSCVRALRGQPRGCRHHTQQTHHRQWCLWGATHDSRDFSASSSAVNSFALLVADLHLGNEEMGGEQGAFVASMWQNAVLANVRLPRCGL